MYDIIQLNDMLVPELRELAEQLGLENYKRLTKQELIYKILDHQAVSNAPAEAAAAEEGDEKNVRQRTKHVMGEEVIIEETGEPEEKPKPRRRVSSRRRAAEESKKAKAAGGDMPQGPDMTPAPRGRRTAAKAPTKVEEAVAPPKPPARAARTTRASEAPTPTPPTPLASPTRAPKERRFDIELDLSLIHI